MDEPLSILVVDDTATYRKIVSDAVKALDCVAETVTAPTGEIALNKLAQSRFDLVLLDLEMPGIGGLETLIRIRRDFPHVEVIIISGVTESAASVTIKAMNAGAFEFVRKPDLGSQAENATQLSRELESVVGAVCRGRQKNGRKATPVSQVSVNSSARQVPVPTAFSVLAIGVSTGGPKALNQVIPALPGDFPLPVVLVQHMPAHYTKAMADNLNRKSALEVLEAAAGDSVQPGRVLIAPGNRHMVLRNTPEGVIVGINGGQRENSCRPAVDVLFRSVASSYGNRGVLAAIMTGMGSDGTKGVQALKRKGCYCLTQSRDSCVVYGMPQVVDSMGLSDESVNLNRFAERLTALATNGGRN